MSQKNEKKELESENREEKILKEIQKKDKFYSRLFYIFIMALLIVSIVADFLMFSSLTYTANEKLSEMNKVLDRVSKRYIAVSPDLKLIVKANILTASKAKQIVEAFLERECNFAESKIWDIEAPYPPFQEFLKKSPLLSRWENYYLDKDAYYKFYSLANFLYTQGKFNKLPEFFYPETVFTENFLFKNNNEFEWKGYIEYTTIYLSMTDGKWKVGRTKVNGYLSGKIDFSIADPVINPYGIKVKDFYFAVPLKPGS
jgi:hypothetical protein